MRTAILLALLFASLPGAARAQCAGRSCMAGVFRGGPAMLAARGYAGLRYGGSTYAPRRPAPDYTQPFVYVPPEMRIAPLDSPDLHGALPDEQVGQVVAALEAQQTTSACLTVLSAAAPWLHVLADQAVRLIEACDGSWIDKLCALRLVAPGIVDWNNASYRLVSLFPITEDKESARAILQGARLAQQSAP